METSRRSFLGGALALLAATSLPAAAFADAPTIYGDGFHDDWAGLQALLDGKPFRVVGSAPMVLRNDGYAEIYNGHFRISRGLRVTKRGVIGNSSFEATPELRGPMITFESGWEGRAGNIYLEDNGLSSGFLDGSFLGSQPATAH